MWGGGGIVFYYHKNLAHCSLSLKLCLFLKKDFIILYFIYLIFLLGLILYSFKTFIQYSFFCYLFKT